MSGRVVGTLRHIPGKPKTDSAAAVMSQWEITAEPDIMIRLKRIMPAIRTTRAAAIYLSDTESTGRELEWILSRWNFEMTPKDRAHLQRRADADREREQSVEAILAGTANVTARQGWLTSQIPLRDCQRVAADLARTSTSLLLGDQLGGGKSATALAILEDPSARPALAVIKTGLGGQWLRELEKFYPQLNGYELRTTKADEEFPKLCGPDGEIAYDLILVNYAKLAAYRHHLAGKVRSVIFDEAHELRRPDSKRYEAAAHIASEANVRLGLTATPVWNFGGEIFSVMDALNQGCLGQRSEFIREWCGGSSPSSGSGTMSKVSVDNAEGLRAHLKSRGLFLRRTLEEMGIRVPGALPIEHVVPSDTAKYQQLSGNAVEMAKLILSQDASNAEKWRTAAELDWRLRQATGIAKAPYVGEFVRMLLDSQEKVLLFGWHRAVYDLWVDQLKEFKPVLYTGSESGAAKARSIEEFTNGDSRVLIISLRAGAGIDGLQHVCSTLVFGELDWSPGVHAQCVGRLDRIGQANQVLAYYCVSTDGSDPVILDTLNVKAMEAKRLTGTADLFGTQPEELGRSQTRQLANAVLQRAGVSIPVARVA
ncbi:SNF2-related protein [Mycolicibacterium fortuitum]|uniref:SNF2-related protein n=1 Tax=Mycolicibacterium fortuitum TaxID=1766 RepID=UPI0026270F39|nr:DEAD/DEAH box helicase [Mycolicibacterium fortuitum]